jgi:catechol 2,3-dioxygenase-like lactoylglutathione lyase family enzyme
MKPRLFLCLLLAALPAVAQLPAPNAAGVSAGHDILTVSDLDAANHFWSVLGAQPGQLGTLKLIKFPGVLFLMRKGEPKGGTEGSSVESIGFKVKDLKASLARWAIDGVTPQAGATETHAVLMGPDGIKVRVAEDRSLATAIAADELVMNVPDVAAAQAWYEKWFGAAPVKHGGETVGGIPGSNLVFVQSKEPVAGTRGRAFDRVGLEVKNLEPFCKSLEAAGIKLDGGYRKATNMALAVCLLTDPWGTFIEVSEGLAAVQ